MVKQIQNPFKKFRAKKTELKPFEILKLPKLRGRKSQIKPFQKIVVENPQFDFKLYSKDIMKEKDPLFIMRPIYLSLPGTAQQLCIDCGIKEPPQITVKKIWLIHKARDQTTVNYKESIEAVVKRLIRNFRSSIKEQFKQYHGIRMYGWIQKTKRQQTY